MATSPLGADVVVARRPIGLEPLALPSQSSQPRSLGVWPRAPWHIPERTNHSLYTVGVVWSEWAWCGQCGRGVVSVGVVWSVWAWCGQCGRPVFYREMAWGEVSREWCRVRYSCVQYMNLDHDDKQLECLYNKQRSALVDTCQSSTSPSFSVFNLWISPPLLIDKGKETLVIIMLFFFSYLFFLPVFPAATDCSRD